MPETIEERVDWGFIRYANCWEDARILCEALNPAPGKRFLSIASGGDNCFSLLAHGADVVGADLNPSQLATVELKVAGIRALSREEFLRFLGIAEADDRIAVYERLRGALPDRARSFWDEHRDPIDAGIVHAGKFERYFQMFRTRVMPLVHRRSTIAELMRSKTAQERRAFYDARWDNVRWRLLFKIFFSRFFMGRHGRDPEFFRFVEGSVADRLLSHVEYALTDLATHDNPWLAYILEGNFTRALPPYLEPTLYERVRVNLDRLTLHRGAIEDAGRAHRGQGFDGFNLSDIFEYLDPATNARIYAELLALSRPGARFAYWNMLVPRKVPEECRGQVIEHAGLAADLFKKDRAFFYSAFVVEEKR